MAPTFMPRQPRLDLPNIPQHIVQRGNDRQPCFFTGIDRIRYLDELREITLREHCVVHAYVLMTNHVQLLMTPTDCGQIPLVMRALGRRYVRYINDRCRRTGTLWEGRYKACLVDNDSYIMRCYRYIELNPLRARMVVMPEDYPWSSFICNAFGTPNPLVRPHPSYISLGADSAERCNTYRTFVMHAASSEELEGIRRHLQSQHAYGSERFRAAFEAQLGRRAGPARIGKPRKSRLFDESAA